MTKKSQSCKCGQQIIFDGFSVLHWVLNAIETQEMRFQPEASTTDAYGHIFAALTVNLLSGEFVLFVWDYIAFLAWKNVLCKYR